MDQLNKKTFIYIGAGLITVIIGYFAFDLIKTNKEAKKFKTSGQKKIDKNTSLSIDEISSNQAQASNDSYPLKIGSYGAKVFVLQMALNKLGQSLIADGKFGQKTYKAINEITFGFGYGNILCGIDYRCKVTYNNWQNIIEKAEDKGFDQNQSWTNAKKVWKV